MKKYSIVHVPNEILLKPTRKVVDFDVSLIKIVDEMYIVMEELHGIGIAANQIGVNLSIFIAKEPEGSMVYINPQITQTHGSVLSLEGCLSIPGKEFKVRRPRTLSIRYQNFEGESNERYITDYKVVRIISHEMDHLNGICIADYCKHSDCSCAYVKNRKGSLSTEYVMNHTEYRKKLGISDLIR